MARRDMTMSDEKLGEKILNYKETKNLADSYKKQAESYNGEIKDEFIARGIENFSWGDTKATVKVTQKEELNELAAIDILRKELSPEDFSNVVKTKEYIDQDALEDAIYNKKIQADVLKSAITLKAPVYTLRLGKAE